MIREAMQFLTGLKEEAIQYTYCERYGNTGHYAEVEEVPACIRHQKNLET